MNAPVTVTADITVKALWEDAPPAPAEHTVTVTSGGNGAEMCIRDRDMSYAQAAEVTGKTVKQITNMVYRGKESLRRLLEREGITNAES